MIIIHVWYRHLQYPLYLRAAPFKATTRAEKVSHGILWKFMCLEFCLLQRWVKVAPIVNITLLFYGNKHSDLCLCIFIHFLLITIKGKRSNMRISYLTFVTATISISMYNWKYFQGLAETTEENQYKKNLWQVPLTFYWLWKQHLQQHIINIQLLTPDLEPLPYITVSKKIFLLWLTAVGFRCSN